MISKLYKLFYYYPNIVTDSRLCEADSIFFALKGNNFDGNNFAEQALEKGCAFVVVDNPAVVKDKRYILVDDVLKTLQELANEHRKQLNIKVIGIAGTNGKTTTKELVAAVLAKKYNIHYTQGNLNNHIGVPKTLLQLTENHQLAVIEMGANHPNEIAELCRIAEPDFGLITNFGEAHLEGFGSLEGVIKAKTELFDFIREKKGRIFINFDNKKMVENAFGINDISYAINDAKADITGHILEQDPFLTLAWSSPRFSVITQKINSKLVGGYNAENLLAAAAVGLFFELEPKDICDALEDYEPKNNRSQYKKTKKNELIIDAYNANPTSVNAALDNFAAMSFAHKTVILGDMLELGEETTSKHQQIADKLAEMKLENVFLIGENFGKCQTNFPKYKNQEDFIKYLKKNPLADNIILIKGSRKISLENLVKIL
ncbi:MAG: UDP-N-acetylmuramoyl-tripeptide--D-alanyl-D-alanine ligase [Prevotellaceae bacterium]|jgi:UDP-N-acetylmuramoyl-tripeptide--D-alanyl-D-alanine ligase|nr:UDP-N-acetylmuramoyl-tripeptide--D-alanyl-D-alanine ligase [Prevotellaceae bacterium]